MLGHQAKVSPPTTYKVDKQVFLLFLLKNMTISKLIREIVYMIDSALVPQLLSSRLVVTEGGSDKGTIKS